MVIPAAVRSALVEHAHAEEPNEACGLIVLRDGVAERYEPARNAAASPYRTLASQPLKIEGASASVQAPASLKAGAEFQVTWSGPNNPRDYITIGNAERKYLDYKYTSGGSPAKITAPEAPGDYEVRYILGQGDTVIATQKVTVGATTASVTVPAQVAGGAKVSISWQGPGNPRDYLTFVPAGAAERTWGRYEYVSKGNPISMVAPDAPGDARDAPVLRVVVDLEGAVRSQLAAALRQVMLHLDSIAYAIGVLAVDPAKLAPGPIDPPRPRDQRAGDDDLTNDS